MTELDGTTEGDRDQHAPEMLPPLELPYIEGLTCGRGVVMKPPEGETALYELIAKTRRSLDDIETAVRLGFLRL